MISTKNKVRIQKLKEQTPQEVPVGTTIVLKKVHNGWLAKRRTSAFYATEFPEVSSKSRNLILALRKVIGIY